MGVTGLWPIVHPCARPIKLETLNRKRLAVDASIWIYQFLKAVRDKEGNALRNSHVVGFFRRICKLLFFGIKPVFVFDGGAPALKRQTVLGRKRRREGRRDDAVRTAGKLLAVQMQRRLEEDEEKRKREKEVRGREVAPEEEEVLAVENLVYVDEIGMSNQERQQTRKFTKKDAYHLPDLNGGIENMGQPNDPRIMSAEELEEYARQFDNGEDINLYDFSKIDFNGEFFMSLPAVDRYNILNAARLRSRLRMGLSKEQLEEMFPDRMAFSKFQIERVRERNELTQRLMHLNGMNDDAMWGITGGGRIAGERDREYVLVKNDGVEGGWALGVVTTDRSLGERNKPIDVDAIHQSKKQAENEEVEDEDDFEDVPIEGLNRLPKVMNPTTISNYDARRPKEIADKRKQLYASRQENATAEEIDSLFVPANDDEDAHPQRLASTVDPENGVSGDEERDLNLAIAMSLQNQHGQSDSEAENMDFEDVAMPVYEQKAVEAPKPLTTSNGRMVAHIVNNRANAAVPKRRATSISSDENDMDLQAALAASRKRNSASDKKVRSAPVPSNLKNPFDGPLPFERLNFKTSIFGSLKPKLPRETSDANIGENEDLSGGFQLDDKEETSKPLPPWMIKTGDIRSDVQEQRVKDLELDAEDRERALEEELLFRRDHGVIEVESSDDDESDVELVDSRVLNHKAIDLTDESLQQSQSEDFSNGVEPTGDLAKKIQALPPQSDIPQDRQLSPERRTEPQALDEHNEHSAEEFIEWSDSDHEDIPTKSSKVDEPSRIAFPSFIPATKNVRSPSPLPKEAYPTKSLSPVFEDVDISDFAVMSLPVKDGQSTSVHDRFDAQEADIVSNVDFDEFSDPEDEELLAQLAIEAEEHARFASTLNNKSAQENQEAYERELKALRNQQKKDRRDADEVSHIMITECQALLRLFGLPYITAPMEAEAQCAELVRLGLVDGIVTDDSDIFLFGGTRVYKNMFNSNKFVECYLSNDLEKELSLSRNQLISVAHLLGSDYTEGLAGIGPVIALEILSEFSSADTGLEEFKAWWSEVQSSNRPKEADASSIFRRKFRRTQATKLFLPPGFPSPAVTDAYLNPAVDKDPEPFQWGVPDLDNLRAFLMATIGWSQERTDEVLVPVIKDMNRREAEGTQSNITRYFEGSVGVGARAPTSQSAGTANGSRGGGEGFAPRVREKESVRMKEAVKKLKAKSAKSKEKDRGLTGTFADEAVEWAKRNELSETAERAKRARKEEERRAKKAKRSKMEGLSGRGEEEGAEGTLADIEARHPSNVGDEADSFNLNLDHNNDMDVDMNMIFDTDANTIVNDRGQQARTRDSDADDSAAESSADTDNAYTDGNEKSGSHKSKNKKKGKLSSRNRDNNEHGNGTEINALTMTKGGRKRARVS